LRNHESLQAPDPYIKQKWFPEFTSGEWFQVNKDLLSEYYAEKDCPTSQYWKSVVDPRERTENFCAWYHATACQGSVLNLVMDLPQSDYEVKYRIKVTQTHNVVDQTFTSSGSFVSGYKFTWTKRAQLAKKSRGYVDIVVGTFSVIQPCRVEFKMVAEWLSEGAMSAGYWVESIKVRAISSDVEDEKETGRPSTDLHLEKGDIVQFLRNNLECLGQILQIHGSKASVQLNEQVGPLTAGEVFSVPFKEIVKVHPKQTGSGNRQVNIIVKSAKTWWDEAVLHGMTEDSYELAIAGKERETRPIETTDVQLLDELPQDSDIHLMDYVLCKERTWWYLSVVMEISPNKDLFCVHTYNALEKVVTLDQLRLIKHDKNQISTDLSSRL